MDEPYSLLDVHLAHIHMKSSISFFHQLKLNPPLLKIVQQPLSNN